MAIKQIILVSEEGTYESMISAVVDAFTNHFGLHHIVEATGLNHAESIEFMNKMNENVFRNALSRCQHGDTISIPGKLHITPLAVDLKDVNSDYWSANRADDLLIIALDCIDRVSKSKLSEAF